MAQKPKEYRWQKQSMASLVDVIDCCVYDPIKDFSRDPSGYYVLIKVNGDTRKIEVAICNKDHVIEAVFRGGKAQDLYEGIFRHEKKNGLRWFDSKGHCAYLGKELRKAELALSSSQPDYYQE